MYLYMNMAKGKTGHPDKGLVSGLPPYPIDLSPLLNAYDGNLDAAGVPCGANTAVNHPTMIARCALAHWNQYLATNGEHHCKAFLTQAYWLVEHEVRIGDDTGGWPISFSDPDLERPWLSALAQGNAISVLVRAYQLTRERAFLEVVQRAVRTFERDILDGGVSVPVGEEGIFFEEVAIYPAAHILSGFILHSLDSMIMLHLRVMSKSKYSFIVALLPCIAFLMNLT